MRKVKRSRDFMKTTITISVAAEGAFSTIEVQDAIELAFGEFDRIVNLYTRFNQTSELARLNRSGGRWHKVSGEFYDLVNKMLELAEKSDGAFDPTTIDFLEVYGYDPNYDFSKLENPKLDEMVREIAKKRASWREIELKSEDTAAISGKQESEVPETAHFVKLKKGQRIDLGGIGKGYATDCAAGHLEHFGNFLIDAGGDIRCQGTNEKGEPWRLALKHKHQDTEMIIGHIEATKPTALASSGSWARKVKNFHHLINPQTGEPAGTIATVYVTAPTTTQADGWATALFVGGKELLEKTADAEGIEVLLIDEVGKAIATKEMQALINS